MKKIAATLIFAVACLMLATCEQGQKKVRLRVKYEPGMKLTYDQLIKGTVFVNAGDSVIRDRTQEINTLIDLQVRRIVDDSIAEVVEQRTSHYKSFDRVDSTETDTVTQDQEMILYVAPSGRVVDFEWSAETDGHRSFNAWMKNFYEQGMPVFPKGEFPQGYTWTQSYKVILEGEEMDASTTYDIKSFAREQGYDCVLIGYDGNLVLPIEVDPKDSLQRHGIDRVRATGVMYFAYKEGFVVLQRERWLLNGDRHKLADGKPVDYSVATEYDVDHVLKEIKRP